MAAGLINAPQTVCGSLGCVHDGKVRCMDPLAKLLHCAGTAWALRAHCVHLPGNSPKITCHLSVSTAKQQSRQENNQHMRGHMEPRAIRRVANLAPNTKLGEVQQDTNRFVKGSPITLENIAIAVEPMGS